MFQRTGWKAIFIVFVFLAVAASLSKEAIAASSSDFGNAHITPYKDPTDDPNKRYAVGFMSYEIWSNSAGVWITKAPGDFVGGDELFHNYNFSFPGRKVKDVQVKRFMPSDPKHIEYFENSRAGNLNDLENYFSKVNSVGTPEGITGKGTSNISFMLRVEGRLNSPDVYDVIQREHNPGDFAPGVMAFRYYFPILFEFMLEPEEGQAIIKYFTTTGQSLDGVDGFQNRSEKLVKGQYYEYEHRPEPANYKYKGYQKRIDKVPAGGPTEPTGDPPGFKYGEGSNNFSTYYVYFYYERPVLPGDGKAVIKHFTTSGQSLDGVDGFVDREEPLTIGADYTFPHTPETEQHKYSGYKEGRDVEPSSGVLATGDPPGFNYDGSFLTYYVYFYYDYVEKIPEPGVVCTDPQSAAVQTASLMNSSAVGKIKADDRGTEKFEVAKGIPTSESLYGNVQAREYLYYNKFEKFTGTCTFTTVVKKKYNLKWKEQEEYDKPDGTSGHRTVNKSSTEEVTEYYDIVRNYSYWTIVDLEVYEIANAKLYNYAFENNGIIILPGSSYNEPSMDVETGVEHVKPPVPISITLPSETIDGGNSEPSVPSEDFSGEAERATPQLSVRNDALTLNGDTVMDGRVVKTNAPAPSKIATPLSIDENALYKPGNVIPMTKANKADAESTGTIEYAPISGSFGNPQNIRQPIGNLNSVTVHTPVVIYPSVSDDKAHNQKTKPVTGRSAIILDRPFTVEMSNSGQHANYRGYGNRNYLKYIGHKQVRFPFDVYDDTRTNFHPKNTWIEVDKLRESFTFYLPVWVDEGLYDVEFRTIAHNAPSDASHQTNANLDLINHIAYDTVPVDAIGRVYDFRITDIADYNWERVFRTQKGSRTPTGVSYWVGLNGIDGTPRGNTGLYTLPIRPGSHPLYKNAVIKTGYHFKFDLKTKGNMFGPQDQIVITPSFDFVDAKDGKRQPVELYYNTGSASYVRISSPSDKVQRYVILNERLRNVPTEELTDTALYKYDHDYPFNQVAGISRSQFVQNFINRQSMQKTPVGSLSLLRLPEGVRTLVGPKTGIPAGVDPARANAAVQRWYGEYSLPAELYAVPAGTNVAEYGRTHGGLTDRSAIFLKNGYIVVNFNIETVRNGETGKPYLKYIHAPLMNQWQGMEGFARRATDPYGRSYAFKDGDVAFYHADLSSRDDFRSTVTH